MVICAHYYSPSSYRLFFSHPPPTPPQALCSGGSVGSPPHLWCHSLWCSWGSDTSGWSLMGCARWERREGRGKIKERREREEREWDTSVTGAAQCHAPPLLASFPGRGYFFCIPTSGPGEHVQTLSLPSNGELDRARLSLCKAAAVYCILLYQCTFLHPSLPTAAIHDQISSLTSQKVFICLSTVLTWARSKPLDPVCHTKTSRTRPFLAVCFATCKQREEEKGGEIGPCCSSSRRSQMSPLRRRTIGDEGPTPTLASTSH